jgi:uncharacterized protein YecA (UPF0149 family)
MNPLNMDSFYNQFNRMRPKRRGTIQNEGNKLKPNQKCPCGSNKKYKKCCQQRLEMMARMRGTNTISEKEINQ